VADTETYVEFVSTRTFEASAKRLLTEEDRRQLELLLLANPRRGEVVQRTGGSDAGRGGRPP
jgi:hypothetical protein